MTHYKNPFSKLSNDELLSFFLSNPQEALDHLFSSGFYLRPQKDAGQFWSNFFQAGIPDRLSSDPAYNSIASTLSQMHLFFHLTELYARQIKNAERDLIKLKPTREALIRALFLSVELGELFTEPNKLPKYSFKSLSAIKQILGYYNKNCSLENLTAYSVELFNTAKLLLMLKNDFQTLNEFIELFEYGEFCISKRNELPGFILHLADEDAKCDNRYLREKVKTAFKRQYKAFDSQNDISNQEHFKKFDRIYKTNEGLATVFYSGGTVTGGPAGTTALEIEEDIFELLESKSSDERNEGMLKMMEKVIETNYHYQLRNALAAIFQPNDTLDVHTYSLKLEKFGCTLYELFSAISSLAALADNLRYTAEFPDSCDLSVTKTRIVSLIRNEHPALREEELESASLSAIVGDFAAIEVINDPFYILSKDTLHKYFRKTEELKGKSDEELDTIVDILSSPDKSIAFNPIYKLRDGFLFAYKTFLHCDVNRAVYDFFVSRELFNNHKTSDSKQTASNHKNREEIFNRSIKEALQSITPFAKSNIDLKKFDNKISGEIDILGYFPKEKLVLSIQVKLSNTTIRTEQYKATWIQEKLLNEAGRQTARDSKILSSPSSGELLSKVFDIEVNEDVDVYHLIVTDNFYADHYDFPITNSDITVLCVSHFELTSLLKNIRIRADQDKWDLFANDIPGNNLIDLLENNVFWRFAGRAIEDYKMNDTLYLIDDEHNIALEV